MNLVDLSKFLITNLVTDIEKVKFKEIKEDKVTIIQILVPDEDMSKIIGYNGNIANAIRTIVQASAYINNLGKVRINIDTI